MSLGDILTKRDVAEFLQVSERTVERWSLRERSPTFQTWGLVRSPLPSVRDYRLDESAPSSPSAHNMVPVRKTRRKLPRGVHARENGTLYICYKNEHGKIIRENTHQTDVRAAVLMPAQARTTSR
jgi:hypothetical protein